MSPGGTTGTEVMRSDPLLKTIMFKVMMNAMLLAVKMHKVEVRAKRFVDGLLDESYMSGVFYASKNGLTGPVGDQGELFSDFNNKTFQDNAREAIHRFLK